MNSAVPLREMTKQSNRTLVDILRERARKTPGNLAFSYLKNGEEDGVMLTYAELDRQARVIASHLQSQGLSGKSALMLYPPGIEFIASFFGCLYAQVLAVPAYPPKQNHHMNRLKSIMIDSDAVAILSLSPLADRDFRFIDGVILGSLNWIATDQVLEGKGEEWEPKEINPDSIAFLQYTSGSTGSPKGVMVSHGNLVHNVQMLKQAYELNETTNMISWLPLFHDMGLIGKVLLAVYVGAPCRLMSPLDFLQRPRRWLQAISKYRIYYSAAPNFAYDMCFRKIKAEDMEGLDLTCWKIAANGAEPIRASTLKDFYHAFSAYGLAYSSISPGFGMAEATLVVSWRQKGEIPVIRSITRLSLISGNVIAAKTTDPDKMEVVGCGKSYDLQEIIIVDPQTLLRCSDNQVGEVWVKGPSVAKGYWKRQEETLTTFCAYTAGEQDGPYLRTGDLGFMDDGELYITGRMKDLLIFRGKNHYPQDIELTVTEAHSALNGQTIAAFSLYSEGEERLVVACEVDRHYKPIMSVDSDQHNGSKLYVRSSEIVDAVRKSVADIHQLQLYDLLLVKRGSIPITSSGKIQRHASKIAYINQDFKYWEDQH